MVLNSYPLKCHRQFFFQLRIFKTFKKFVWLKGLFLSMAIHEQLLKDNLFNKRLDFKHQGSGRIFIWAKSNRVLVKNEKRPSFANLKLISSQILSVVHVNVTSVNRFLSNLNVNYGNLILSSTKNIYFVNVR